jgi:hypothetical protein
MRYVMTVLSKNSDISQGKALKALFGFPGLLLITCRLRCKSVTEKHQEDKKEKMYLSLGAMSLSSALT